MFKEMETVEVAKTTLTGVFELVKRALLKSKNPAVVLLAQQTVDSIYKFVSVITDKDVTQFYKMEEITKTELEAIAGILKADIAQKLHMSVEQVEEEMEQDKE